MEINKPIYLVTADMYLRFPEIMEEEYNELLEFLQDEHIVYSFATSDVLKLQNNWNELKEWLQERKFVPNITGEDLDEDMSITEVLSKMQEIEGGVDND